ncbi:MAG: NAD-dependent epimerase/dehydratase family protein [Polyangiaceae bacterium]|nr:NAD-dependent epimerase/dehydratase family protein [Polyangiaceae bacterium]
MARFLVTGGAGFIGSNLVAALARAGERVVALDDLSTGRWSLVDRLLRPGDAEVERHTASIVDGAAVARAMRGVEVVFHEAAQASVEQSLVDPLGCEEVNVRGLLTVLEAARDAGVRRVVFTSSCAVYGDEPSSPKTEQSPARPLSPYAVTKLAGELHLAAWARLHGREALSFRNFNTFGPNQLPDGPYAAAIPRFVWAWLGGEPARVHGDGRQSRDFVHVDDVVRANLAAASSTRALLGEVVNLASGRETTVLDVLASLRALGLDGGVEHTAPRRGDIRRSCASLELASSLLGYSPRVAWSEGLSSTVDFLRDARAGRVAG